MGDYFSIGSLGVGLFEVLLFVLILLFLCLCCGYICWVLTEPVDPDQTRLKTAKATNPAVRSDATLEGMGHRRDGHVANPTFRRENVEDVYPERGPVQPVGPSTTFTAEEAGLSLKQSPLKRGMKATVSLRNVPMTEEEEVANDEISASARWDNEKLERWSESADQAADATLRTGAMTDGAGTPVPVSDYELEDVALAQALQAQVEEARHAADAESARSVGEHTALATLSRQNVAAQDAKSVGGKSTKTITEEELEAVRREAFERGARSVKGPSQPPLDEDSRKVSGAQLEALWSAAFEEGARAGGLTDRELEDARESAARERARSGDLRNQPSVALTSEQIQQLWLDAHSEGVRTAVMRGRGGPSVRASVRQLESSTKPPSDVQRRKSKSRPRSVKSRPPPQQPPPSNSYAAWGDEPPQPRASTRQHVTFAPPPPAHRASSRGRPPELWRTPTYDPRFPPPAQAIEHAQQTRSSSARRSSKKERRSQRRSQKEPERPVAAYGDSPYQPLGIQTANPALKRELRHSFMHGTHRPTYDEPPAPPSPGY